ncbi:hypothetical protein MJI37_32910, partial [Salmonella enterica subsp. enterica serovar Cerro]|nr:hypothetical protein [Salmonella enterica subsp. enterica serovar Cerro]
APPGNADQRQNYRYRQSKRTGYLLPPSTQTPVAGVLAPAGRNAETWAYCLQQTQGHPDADLLLWRGVEMVEILSTLSMDIDTLR